MHIQILAEDKRNCLISETDVNSFCIRKNHSQGLKNFSFQKKSFLGSGDLKKMSIGPVFFFFVFGTEKKFLKKSLSPEKEMFF